jgi:methionine-rich copper-binding protein CopC
VKRTQQSFDFRKIWALFFAVFLFALPEVSQGHVFPDHADPKVGATINASPERVRIWFDGAMEPAFSKIMVHSADGKMVDKRDGRVNSSDPTLLEVSLPPLPAGTYQVMWNVVSRDGHRTMGNFTFIIK